MPVFHHTCSTHGRKLDREGRKSEEPKKLRRKAAPRIHWTQLIVVLFGLYHIMYSLSFVSLYVTDRREVSTFFSDALPNAPLLVVVLFTNFMHVRISSQFHMVVVEESKMRF